MKFKKLAKEDVEIRNSNRNIAILCDEITSLSHKVFRSGFLDNIEQADRLAILKKVEEELVKIKSLFPY